jgi:glutaminyl-peptide cyclotransferase
MFALRPKINLLGRGSALTAAITLTPVSRAAKGGLCAGLAVVAMAGCDGDGGDAAARTEPAASIAGAARAFDPGRAFRDLRAQVTIGPRSAGSPGSRREVRLIVSRLREARLRRAVVQRPHRNVVARLRGTRPGVIVVGAHHDTKDAIPGFVGANDGASGVAVLLELARVLPRPFPGPSIALAFFDAEEARGSRSFQRDGTRGSRQFVRLARGARQASPALRAIRAMFLVDLVGDCDLQIPREGNSDRRLYALMSGPPFGGETAGILDDHIPFLAAGIPAVDLIDFSYGPGGSPGAWFHTREDTLDKVCPGSLGAVGRPLIRALGAAAAAVR